MTFTVSVLYAVPVKDLEALYLTIEIANWSRIVHRRVNLGYIASSLGIPQVTLCHLRNKVR